ncbi:hypothetical protein FB451DRAFT_1325531 [Mycena latifolia]|nr:hypothetical protein FB451DRAFT_1325531 [Mycena latifolia]
MWSRRAPRVSVRQAPLLSSCGRQPQQASPRAWMQCIPYVSGCADLSATSAPRPRRASFARLRLSFTARAAFFTSSELIHLPRSTSLRAHPTPLIRLTSRLGDRGSCSTSLELSQSLNCLCADMRERRGVCTRVATELRSDMERATRGGGGRRARGAG